MTKLALTNALCVFTNNFSYKRKSNYVTCTCLICGCNMFSPIYSSKCNNFHLLSQAVLSFL